MKFWQFLVLAVLVAAATSGCTRLAATSSPAVAIASNFCDRARPLSATEQGRLLRFAAVVRNELAAVNQEVVLISRAGLDLSRFDIRYTHAAIGWKSDDGIWNIRQLYYDCDDSRPRIFDQGVAGFVMGIDDASIGYISIVSLPPAAARSLKEATLDTGRALRLLAATYSANAYAFGLDYQNCNQWVAEVIATAWGELDDGENLRERAQQWLQQAGYEPQPVVIGSQWLMLASSFVPFVNLNDHPRDDRKALALRVSLPNTLEAFIRQHYSASERIEICHDGQHAVVRKGWEPMGADGCLSGSRDRVVALNEL